MKVADTNTIVTIPKAANGLMSLQFTDTVFKTEFIFEAKNTLRNIKIESPATVHVYFQYLCTDERACDSSIDVTDFWFSCNVECPSDATIYLAQEKHTKSCFPRNCCEYYVFS